MTATINNQNWFTLGNYEVKEQYYVYDGNALIGDIGGYFCMFLSTSKFLAALFEFIVTKYPHTKKQPMSPMTISSAKLAWEK